ncbi:hypothetical protein TNCV_2727131 [Trichonephila clavipes]|nr:hypothetical protein TNCV_2727131 [Trichonephila clavipes]
MFSVNFDIVTDFLIHYCPDAKSTKCSYERFKEAGSVTEDRLKNIWWGMKHCLAFFSPSCQRLTLRNLPRSPASAHRKKAEAEKSRLKTMFITCCDSEDIIHKEFLLEGTMMNVALSNIVKQYLAKKGLLQMEHPPYSPDPQSSRLLPISSIQIPFERKEVWRYSWHPTRRYESFELHPKRKLLGKFPGYV